MFKSFAPEKVTMRLLTIRTALAPVNYNNYLERIL